MHSEASHEEHVQSELVPIDEPTPEITHNRRWPATKSDSLLRDVSPTNKPKTACKKIRGVIFPVIVIGIVLGLIVMLFIINNTSLLEPSDLVSQYNCSSNCSIELVESIPENLTYPSGSPSHKSTFQAWSELISTATSTLDIASMYWTLRGQDVYVHPSDYQGEAVFQLLSEAIKRGVSVRIAQNQPEPNQESQTVETLELKALGAQLRYLNFTHLVGEGILHTKFLLVDGKHFYTGSANMDWRSLTQVKEMGAYVQNCPCLAADLTRLFDIYWALGLPDATIPSHWDPSLDTAFNLSHPLNVLFTNHTADVFLASSPAQLCTASRTSDIDAIMAVMNDSRKTIDIAVMDYFPSTIYRRDNIFWPVIDDMLRRSAFEKNVQVRLMASWWNHSRPDMLGYLQSLHYFSPNIHVKVFIVPSEGDQAKIPFARVNHNKYMVTDRAAYIGTSNWSGDYFISTGGVGLVVNDTSSGGNVLRQQLADVFSRDWESSYAHSLDQNTSSLLYIS